MFEHYGGNWKRDYLDALSAAHARESYSLHTKSGHSVSFLGAK